MKVCPGRRAGGPEARAGAFVLLVLCAAPVAAQSTNAVAAPIAMDTAAIHVSTLTRLVVSIRARTLWVIDGVDTLRTVPVAVASGRVLRYGARAWRFALPIGKRVVRAKRTDPVWTPPDWLYVEAGRANQLRVRQLPAAGVPLRNGQRLVLRDSLVGLLRNGEFSALPVDEHIVFDGTLFIPPVASLNRRVSGELGKYALDLGDGYLLHGTRDESSIGTASTHGCLRMGEDDLAWVCAHTPIGAVVLVR